MWTDLDERMWETQYSISKNGFITLPVPLAEGDTLRYQAHSITVVDLLTMNSNTPTL
jgi:hypothetical protein